MINMSIEDVIRETIERAVKEALGKTVQTDTHTLRRLFSTKDAAEYLSCSIDEIRSLVASGRLPITWLSEDSSKWRFDKVDLDVVINTGKGNQDAKRGKATNEH